MNAAPDSSWRLQRLAQILAESKALASTSARDTDPADVHIGSAPLERIKRLTAELTQEASTGVDDIDRVAMQLLLNDYAVAVAHLRAAMRLTEQRMIVRNEEADHPALTAVATRSTGMNTRTVVPRRGSP